MLSAPWPCGGRTLRAGLNLKFSLKLYYPTLLHAMSPSVVALALLTRLMRKLIPPSAKHGGSRPPSSTYRLATRHIQGPISLSAPTMPPLRPRPPRRRVSPVAVAVAVALSLGAEPSPS